jgi:hypothetical protein
MNAHLQDQQLADWILGARDHETAHHVAHCEACRAAIDDLDGHISDYRDRIASEADRDQIFWTRQARSIHNRLRAPRFTPVLRWACATMMMLVVSAAFLVTRVPRPQQPVVTSDSADDVLLQQIESDVAREYPAALAPAALIAEEREGALAGGGTSSLNNATHKEQDR